MEGIIRIDPSLELALDSFDHAVEESEVPIVEAEPAGQFPHTLDGVQVRTIGRKKLERESGLL